MAVCRQVCPAAGLRILLTEGAASQQLSLLHSACVATNYAALDGRGGSAEEVALRREWARHEAVMTAIAEPSSQESLIAARASERITAICRELGLDDSVIELAHQARVPPSCTPTGL